MRDMYMRMRICVYAYMRMRICAYAYTYMPLYVYAYAYMYKFHATTRANTTHGVAQLPQRSRLFQNNVTVFFNAFNQFFRTQMFAYH